MAASLRPIQLAKDEPLVAGQFSESDLLELLPQEVRPLVKPCLSCLVRIAELGAMRALASRGHVESGPNLITVKKAAARLDVSLGMIRNLVASGELEQVPVRRSKRIVKASLDAFIERKRQRGVR